MLRVEFKLMKMKEFKLCAIKNVYFAGDVEVALSN